MRLRGLTPVTIPQVDRHMMSSLGNGVTQHGSDITLVESGGWNSSQAIFARRDSAGAIVLVSPEVYTIVDRHESAGCSRFVGGRAWFDEITYRLPAGTTFGGKVKVEYDNHIVVPDYSDHQSDGTPCPPPAID